MHKLSSFLLLVNISFLIIMSACTAHPTEQYVIAANILKGSFFLNFKVEAIGMDGSGKVNYPFPKQLGYQPNWSPDGMWIVTSVGGRRAGSNADLLFINPKENYRYQLVTPEQGEASPRWSSDGRSVAYSSGSKVYIMDVSCVLQMEKCQPQPTYVAEGLDPVWSPDDTRLTFSYKGDVFIVQLNEKDRWVQIDPDDNICLSPQWSPDGLNIVASCNKIISLLSPSEDSIKSLGANGFMPSWSPDGEKIIFISTDGDGLGHMLGWEACNANALFAMNTNGNNLQRLTYGKNECVLEFTWLPTINSDQ